MINKQSLWFLTLFSLILVLSVYYITMPNELLEEKNTGEKVVIAEESENLTALRVSSEEERLTQINDLRMVLTDLEASIEEKNNAYEKLKLIDITKGKEEFLEEKVEEKFKLKTFIKLEDSQVKVVVSENTHSSELANKIMRCIQEEFEEKMYISVKFQA